MTLQTRRQDKHLNKQTLPTKVQLTKTSSTETKNVALVTRCSWITCTWYSILKMVSIEWQQFIQRQCTLLQFVMN